VIKQYSIVLTNLDPTVGSEIKKTRPCLVISPNQMNFNLNTIIIAPLTSNTEKYPSRVEIKHNRKDRMIALDQIKTIDKSRIIKIYDRVGGDIISDVKLFLHDMLIK